MLRAVAATQGVPAWLAAALVGLTTLGAIVNVVGSVVNAYISLRRLEAMDAQRAELDTVRHNQIMQAITGGSNDTPSGNPSPNGQGATPTH